LGFGMLIIDEKFSTSGSMSTTTSKLRAWNLLECSRRDSCLSMLLSEIALTYAGASEEEEEEEEEEGELERDAPLDERWLLCLLRNLVGDLD